MAYEFAVRQYRYWYARLLQLYPRSYRERFGESMKQTFNDLLRERLEAQQGLFGFSLWVFAETSAGILREEVRFMTMQSKNIARIALAVGLVLLIPLILTLLNQGAEGQGWNWEAGDFVAAFMLLFGAGVANQLISNRVSHAGQRIAIGVSIAVFVFLLWAELAVDALSKAVNFLLG